MLWREYLASPIGRLCVEASEIGITRVTWSGKLRSKRSAAEPAPKFLKQAVRQLQEYFAGKRTQFTVPLDIQGTEFQKRAWAALVKIPFGVTHSYQEQAKAVGNFKAARAVGAANRVNKIPIFIPCHRVVGKNGQLVGFAGGLARKSKLLAIESQLASRH